MIPEYLKPQVEKAKNDIIEGIESAKEIIPTMTTEQAIQSLYNQYLREIGYVNGLRNCDIEDKHRVKIFAYRAALRCLGMELK